MFAPAGSFGPPWHPLTLRLALLTIAATIYHETLLHTPQAIAYLERRGVRHEVARAAYLGYADDAALERSLAHTPALLPVAQRIGLLNARGHDILHGRLIIPEIRDGLCIWLHGRLLPEESGMRAEEVSSREKTTEGSSATLSHAAPKYLGCALEKPLLGAGLCEQFGVSSRGTQGLYHGSLRSGIVVVEGAFDLLTFLSWRLPIHCVALVGTHASAGQLSHLVALAAGGPIWIALDADAAGETGAQRLAKQLTHYPQGVERLSPPFGAKDFSEVAIHSGAREQVLRALTGRGPHRNTAIKACRVVSTRSPLSAEVDDEGAPEVGT